MRDLSPKAGLKTYHGMPVYVRQDDGRHGEVNEYKESQAPYHPSILLQGYTVDSRDHNR